MIGWNIKVTEIWRETSLGILVSILFMTVTCAVGPGSEIAALQASGVLRYNQVKQIINLVFGQIVF